MCTIVAKTFGLLLGLIAPVAVEEKTYEELVSVLKRHYEPGTSAIVARFRFHTCVREESELMSIFLAQLREAGETVSVSAGVAGRDVAGPAGLWHQTRAATVAVAQ